MPIGSALEMFSREFAAPGTSWSPGTTGVGGRPSVAPVLRQFAFLIPKEQVTPTVMLGETTFTVHAAASHNRRSRRNRWRPPRARCPPGRARPCRS